MSRVAAALVLVLSAALPASAANSIVGTWELISASPVTAADSDPHGTANHKLHFTTDGVMYVVEPSAKLSKSSPSVRYLFDGRKRTVIASDGHRESNPTKIAGDTMTVTTREGGTLVYRRLDADRELAPISLEVVAVEGAHKPPVIHYDDRDSSKLPMRDRIRGVWEAVQYADVDAGDVPPFGFPNDKFVITDKTVTIVPPNETAITRAHPTGNYVFGGDKLIVDKDEVWKISFDRWQRLVIRRADATITMRLITRSTSTIPKLPVKIALYKEKE